MIASTIINNRQPLRSELNSNGYITNDYVT